MKISVSAVTALLLIGEVSAFSTTSPFHRVATTLSNTATKEKETSSDVQVDVSIPYDAAARLAYDEWRVTYKKGDFDATRYESFKNNYKVLTVANISASKKAKDAGEEAPEKMELNEFADMSFDEYNAMNLGGEEESSEEEEKSDSGSILETAMAGSAAQEAASSSLEEAAAALAEEEQV